MENSNQNFAFNEDHNVAVFTTKHVFSGNPILRVYHHEDGAWEFHSEGNALMEDMMIVGLEEITNVDSTINLLSDLRLGEEAWRNSATEPWQTRRSS